MMVVVEVVREWVVRVVFDVHMVMVKKTFEI